MFSIRPWGDENNLTNMITMKNSNCDKTVAINNINEELNKAITTFILHVVIHMVGLSWITEKGIASNLTLINIVINR